LYLRYVCRVRSCDRKVVMSSPHQRMEPDEDHRQLFSEMEKKTGRTCGVHDPDFVGALEGSLHFETPHGIGQRHMLRLECEDMSLNLQRPMRECYAEAHSGMFDGYGIALKEAADGTPVRILIMDSADDRDCLLQVLDMLREEPRTFRRLRSSSLLACACLPVCGVKNKRSASSPAKAGQQKLKASHSVELDESADGPFAGCSTGGGGGRASSPRRMEPRSEDVAVNFPGLDTLKAHAKRLFDEERSRSAPRMRSTGSFRFSFGSSGAKDGKNDDIQKSLNSAATPSRASDEMDPVQCPIVLARLLCKGDEALQNPHRAVDLFGDPELVKSVGFERFWSVFLQTLLVDKLLVESRADQASGKCDWEPPLKVEKWRWFLVKSQLEERNVIENASARIAALEPPEVDHDQVTFFGLSKYLCCAENSLFAPERQKVHQDMSRPLSEYWIASAHHIYDDPPGEDDDSAACGALAGIRAALTAKCRCLSLALVANDNEEVHVLLRGKTVPFIELLLLIRDECDDQSYPVILVLCLTRLPAELCANVPGMLQAELKEKLWKDTTGRMPSPESAKGKIIVVLAPLPHAGSDPAMAMELPWRSTTGATAAAYDDPIDEEIVLAPWENASQQFAVWPGRAFDHSSEKCSPDDRSVAFLPSDELHGFDDAKVQQVTERNREQLTVAYPVAHRAAGAGFNIGGAWHSGVQMAAVTICPEGRANRGRGDSSVVAHSGRFAEDNGGCGYVLKPESLRRHGIDDANGGKVLRLDLRVIAARAVPGLVPGRLVEGLATLVVSIVGAPDDCASKASSRPSMPKGAVLSWPEPSATNSAKAVPAKTQQSHLPAGAAKTMSFEVKSEKTAMLCFEIMELDATSGGARRVAAYACPVHGIREGLRWVPLWPTSEGGDTSRTQYGDISGMLLRVSLTQETRRRARAKPTA